MYSARHINRQESLRQLDRLLKPQIYLTFIQGGCQISGTNFICVLDIGTLHCAWLKAKSNRFAYIELRCSQVARVDWTKKSALPWYTF